MFKRFSTIFVILTIVMAIQAEEKQPGPAVLMEGMGTYHHKITTSSEQAQKFFDQGLTLAYAFNHAEAERSFREAARLDPNCAMCYWGISLVLGPNINMQMDKESVPPAYVALNKAKELMKNASAKEQDYITALATRYGPSAVQDRTKFNEAYADAMREVAKKYPDDLDAATLFAEAMMDIHPWDYYNKETREPQPWTPEIVSTLESVMKRNPNHPGANHFYIHAVEASNHPERGLPMAGRLSTLVPAAGHLVHMPAHIYIRTGDYKKASETNEHAIKSDNSYLSGCHAPGAYSMVYVPHNHHFLSASATLEGRSKVALDSANAVRSKVDPQMMRQEGMTVLQHFYMVPTFVMMRFGMWDDILKSPAPDKDLIYPTGIWHYARGLALLRTGKIDDAKKELEYLITIAKNPALEKMLLMDLHKTTDLTQIEVEHLTGEIAAASKDFDSAITHLQKAVQIEDNLTYDEPPVWPNPMRHYLGAVLLDAKRSAEAEKVYREELTKFPRNGWSLFGLEQSLIAQNKKQEADTVKKDLDVAWAAADIKLSSSRL
jgi:tetratricopeptide (TPR) repeat protein